MKKIIGLLLCTALIILLLGCTKANKELLSGHELSLSVDQLHLQFGNGEEAIIEDPNVISEINAMISSSDYTPVVTTEGVGQIFTIKWSDQLSYSSSGYLTNNSKLYQVMNKEVNNEINELIQSGKIGVAMEQTMKWFRNVACC